ncbi:MAG: hypothetical protein K6F67_04920 [Oscillospiraceae bacterium]|nr:hypothetical protein [Oscillospiraceae bacterium]
MAGRRLAQDIHAALSDRRSGSLVRAVFRYRGARLPVYILHFGAYMAFFDVSLQKNRIFLKKSVVFLHFLFEKSEKMVYNKKQPGYPSAIGRAYGGTSG